MPDRVIPPLGVAVSAGFILGLIASVNEFNHSPQVLLGVIGVVLSIVVGLASPLRQRGGAVDIGTVAVLRALTCAGLFVFLYAGMIDFLEYGQIVLGLIWWVIAAVFAGLATQIRVRGPATDDEDEGEEGKAAS